MLSTGSTTPIDGVPIGELALMKEVLFGYRYSTIECSCFAHLSYFVRPYNYLKVTASLQAGEKLYLLAMVRCDIDHDRVVLVASTEINITESMDKVAL